MTRRGIGALTSRTLRQALSAACGCAARQWKIDISRSVGNLTLRIEI